jgi:hypothetical protein
MMSIAGISGAVRGRHRTITTRRQNSAPRHADLVNRGCTTSQDLDELWVADFSYVWTHLQSTPKGLTIQTFRTTVPAVRVDELMQLTKSAGDEKYSASSG